MRQPIVRPKRDRKEIWQGQLKGSEGSNPPALCEFNPVVEQTVPRQNLFQAPADASSNYSRNGFYLAGPMSPCLRLRISSHQSGQALGLSSNAEFCVSRIWSRLHQELVSGSG